MTEISDISILESGALFIHWNDSHRSFFEGRSLRSHCPCAGCVDEWTGKKMVHLQDFDENLKILRIETSGRYGIKVFFSDGHSTGIYSYERLRSLCDCALCSKLKPQSMCPGHPDHLTSDD